MSSITHERFDISPDLFHICTGSTVPESNFDKEVGHGTRPPGIKNRPNFQITITPSIL